MLRVMSTEADKKRLHKGATFDGEPLSTWLLKLGLRRIALIESGAAPLFGEGVSLESPAAAELHTQRSEPRDVSRWENVYAAARKMRTRSPTKLAEELEVSRGFVIRAFQAAPEIAAQIDAIIQP